MSDNKQLNREAVAIWEGSNVAASDSYISLRPIEKALIREAFVAGFMSGVARERGTIKVFTDEGVPA